MIERFTLIECNGNIEDGCTQSVYDGGEDVFELLDLLNSLNDKNEQLKMGINSLKLLVQNWEALDEEKDGQLDKQNQALKKLKKENEQLKKQNADWETSLDICKHYKEAYGTEIVKIKQTIKDMMENERTELGRSVLRQLWEAIQ